MKNFNKVYECKNCQTKETFYIPEMRFPFIAILKAHFLCETCRVFYLGYKGRQD